jgi:hypothetical protein
MRPVSPAVATGCADARRRLPVRLGDESGIALVLALLVMLVLTLALTSTIYLASAGQRHASTSNAEQRALAVAEAGLSNATSILFSLADPRTGPVPASGSLDGGAQTWSFQRAGTTWTLSGTGKVANPAVPGGTLTRTVTRQFAFGASPLWQWNYSDATTGCMTVKNNATLGQPLYVRGNLCISNNAHFTGSRLQVGGTLAIGNGGSVGFAGSPIAEAKLAGGCLPTPHPCTASDDVYATPPIAQSIDNLGKPPVDLPGWYQNAQPGPKHPCTSGSVPGGFDSNSAYDNSRASFTLTPATSYDCVVTSGSTTVGRLSWDAMTSVLTIAGTIFFDGPLLVNGTARYQGQGNIYAAGAITFNNSAQLCGVPGCGTWNPSTNLLVLVAGAPSGTGFTLSNNAVYQGAAYVVSDYVSSNNSVNWGPVIAHELDISNNAGFVPITSVPPGAPGADSTLKEIPGSWTG